MGICLRSRTLATSGSCCEQTPQPAEFHRSSRVSARRTWPDDSSEGPARFNTLKHLPWVDMPLLLLYRKLYRKRHRKLTVQRGTHSMQCMDSMHGQELDACSVREHTTQKPSFFPMLIQCWATGPCPWPSDTASTRWPWSSANLSSDAIGSLPAERIKMSGIVAEESLYPGSMENGMGSTYLNTPLSLGSHSIHPCVDTVCMPPSD